MKEDADVNSLLLMSALEPDTPRRDSADVNFRGRFGANASSMSADALDAPRLGSADATLLSMIAIDASTSTSLLVMSML